MVPLFLNFGERIFCFNFSDENIRLKEKFGTWNDDGIRTRDLWCQKQPACNTAAPFACCLDGPKTRRHRPGPGRLGPGRSSDSVSTRTSSVQRTGFRLFFLIALLLLFLIEFLMALLTGVACAIARVMGSNPLRFNILVNTSFAFSLPIGFLFSLKMLRLHSLAILKENQWRCNFDL